MLLSVGDSPPNTQPRRKLKIMKLTQIENKYRKQYVLFKFIDNDRKLVKVLWHSKNQGQVLEKISALPKPFKDLALIFCGPFPRNAPKIFFSYPIPGRFAPLLLALPANRAMPLPE
jgi:hypothetical protein